MRLIVDQQLIDIEQDDQDFLVQPYTDHVNDGWYVVQLAGCCQHFGHGSIDIEHKNGQDDYSESKTSNPLVSTDSTIILDVSTSTQTKIKTDKMDRIVRYLEGPYSEDRLAPLKVHLCDAYQQHTCGRRYGLINVPSGLILSWSEIMASFAAEKQRLTDEELLVKQTRIFEENLVRSTTLGWQFDIVEFKRGDPHTKYRIMGLALKPEDEFKLVTAVYFPKNDERNNWTMKSNDRVRIELTRGAYKGIYSVHRLFFDDFTQGQHVPL